MAFWQNSLCVNGGNHLLYWLFEQADRARRQLGNGMDTLGLGHEETPFREVLTAPSFTLKAYHNDRVAGPVLLIVPAPIKRGYIWDLDPTVSVVRACLRRGLRVYLLDWASPGREAQALGLDAYADRFIGDCVNRACSETGEKRLFLAGHSFGGTLATLFAARHPERVAGLVLLGAPLHFGPHVGAIDTVIAAAPRLSLPPLVPGSFMSAAAWSAAPVAFEWAREWDLLRCWGNPQALLTHWRVERWTLDETPMTQRLAEDVIERLYHQDHFLRGKIILGGSRVSPSDIRVPLLAVIDPRCRVVPPQAVLPFYRAVASADKTLLRYPGDTGVALQAPGPAHGTECTRAAVAGGDSLDTRAQQQRGHHTPGVSGTCRCRGVVTR